MHFAVVKSNRKAFMQVADIPAGFERYWGQRNPLALGVESPYADVHNRFKVRIASKHTVRCAVFLEDHDNMFEGSGRRR